MLSVLSCCSTIFLFLVLLVERWQKSGALRKRDDYSRKLELSCCEVLRLRAGNEALTAKVDKLVHDCIMLDRHKHLACQRIYRIAKILKSYAENPTCPQLPYEVPPQAPTEGSNAGDGDAESQIDSTTQED